MENTLYTFLTKHNSKEKLAEMKVVMMKGFSSEIMCVGLNSYFFLANFYHIKT